MHLYPLRFQPIFRHYLWGGRRLESLLGKSLPPETDVAESWEIVDRPADQSVVLNGPLQGTTLETLRERRPKELYGRHHELTAFPLLFKFLDAHRNLSVQVHPSDEQAAQLPTPDRGKTEAWVILHAEPGSRIYAGLKRGFDRHALAREVARGTTELCLHSFEPQAGDCVFLPAGTVHALGAGLVVAEIQQSSDTTFRLFDWNRVGPDGKPRELHVSEALDTLDDAAGPVEPQTPQPTDQSHVERLVACPQFVLDRWKFTAPHPLGGDDRFHLLAVLEGSVACDLFEQPLVKGDTALLPARHAALNLAPDDQAVLLDIYLP